MNEIQEAIEILTKSNERLATQIQKVKSTKPKVESVGLTEKYYSVLENCEKEYHACKMAITALQEQEERTKEQSCGYKKHCGWCSLFDKPCDEVCEHECDSREPVSK